MTTPRKRKWIGIVALLFVLVAGWVFHEKNDRPYWQAVIKDHTAFLNSIPE